ncbi:hypothetical protein SH668x_000378 [Planctomicrobium sp. SH668]|uniref:hypothetical protein n=1 Tax=Planctomicrobium sp. SH668 TaxID=3448126 RepID=UPI003F5B7C50
MNRYEDDDLDDDYPEDSEDHGTIPCPSCGADIYEDAPQCPICGEYVTSTSRSAWDGKPLWYIIIGLAGIFAVIGSMFIVI